MDRLKKMWVWFVMILTRQEEVASLKRCIKIRDELLEAYVERDEIAANLIKVSRAENILHRAEIERLRAIVACPVCGEETADVLAMGCDKCMVELVGGC